MRGTPTLLVLVFAHARELTRCCGPAARGTAAMPSPRVFVEGADKTLAQTGV